MNRCRKCGYTLSENRGTGSCTACGFNELEHEAEQRREANQIGDKLDRIIVLLEQISQNTVVL